MEDNFFFLSFVRFVFAFLERQEIAGRQAGHACTREKTVFGMMSRLKLWGTSRQKNLHAEFLYAKPMM